jgi:WD40 repeat protein
MPVSLLEGPAKLVRTAHFAPNSLHVLGASSDGTARIWDANSQYRRWNTAAVAEDCGFVTSLEPDRRTIAVPCRDRATRIWDTARDQLIAELPPTAVAPAVSADGQRAAIAHDDIIEIYDVPGGRLLRSLRHNAAVSALGFAADGRDLILGAVDGSILVIRDGHEPLPLPPALRPIDAVALLADGRALAADAGEHLRVISRGIVVADLELRSRISLLRPSPDGDRLVGVPAATASATPTLWDLASYRTIGSLDGHLGRVFSARWVAAGRLLTTGSDGSARMWDGSGTQLVTYRGGTRFLADAALSPSGDLVAGGGADGRLRFWDAATGRPLWTTPAHTGAVVGVHYEGEDVITRGVGGDVARWHVPTK